MSRDKDREDRTQAASSGRRGTAGRGTAARGAQTTASRGTAQRGTAARGTATKSTATKSTASRGTTARGTAARGTPSRSPSSRSNGASAPKKTTRSAPQRGTQTLRPAPKSEPQRRTSSGTRQGNQRTPVRRKATAVTAPVNTTFRRVIGWVEAFIEAAIIVFVLFFFIWPLKVEGTSMEPAAAPGDRIVVSRLASFLGFIDRGDVVICTLTDEEGESVSAVKRVIGVPDDIVTISGGVVSVNGVIQEETYLAAGVTTQPDTYYVLGKNEYFVMGDNRPVSGDSRAYGPIEKSDIAAKVVFKFFPFSTMGFY